MIGFAASHVALLLLHLLATGMSSAGASMPEGRMGCQSGVVEGWEGRDGDAFGDACESDEDQHAMTV